MRKITEVLNCDISALIDYGAVSHYEIMQMFFDYEREIKLIPVFDKDNSIKLISIDSKFKDFLIEWYEMREKHYNGEITDEEFEDWKLSYSIKPIEKSIEMEM